MVGLRSSVAGPIQAVVFILPRANTMLSIRVIPGQKTRSVQQVCLSTNDIEFGVSRLPSFTIQRDRLLEQAGTAGRVKPACPYDPGGGSPVKSGGIPVKSGGGSG